MLSSTLQRETIEAHVIILAQVVANIGRCTISNLEVLGEVHQKVKKAGTSRMIATLSWEENMLQIVHTFVNYMGVKIALTLNW